MAKFSQTDQFVNVKGFKLDTSIIEPKMTVKGSALYIHGGGETSSKNLYLPIAKTMAKQGYSGLVFSFPGHGESEGQIAGSSLKARAQITKELAKKFDCLPGSILCASSMGAHIAMRIANENFSKLALFVPAIYAAEAEDKHFGPAFSEILRKPGSYKNSLALKSLRDYRGKLVTFQAGKDKIIPPEVIDLIWENAVSTASKDRIIFNDSPHGITDWICRSKKRLDSVTRLLVD